MLPTSLCLMYQAIFFVLRIFSVVPLIAFFFIKEQLQTRVFLQDHQEV